MPRSKSFRRHHHARLLKKRSAEIAHVKRNVSRLPEDHRELMAFVRKAASVRVTTGALCSCRMCGNPRRHRGNSLTALTRREVIGKDWMAEVYMK